MANLSKTGLTYTLINQSLMGGPKPLRRRVMKITTGTGEYPTGGLPLDKARMGLPNEVQSVTILEQSEADLFRYEWDRTADTTNYNAGRIKVIRDDNAEGTPAQHANASFTSPDELIIEAIGW